MDISTSPNDLDEADPDCDLLVDISTYTRQIRQGKPLDDWQWEACSQADVDAARRIVRVVRRHERGETA